MNALNRIFIPAVLGALSACQPGAPTLTDELRQAIGDTVTQRTSELVTAAERMDVEATFAFFSSRPEFTAVDNGVFYQSLDSLRNVYRGIFAGFRSQDIQVTESKIHVPTADIAIMTLRGTFAPTDTAGTMAPARVFGWTNVWVRDAGAWKVIHTHQSFLP